MKDSRKLKFSVIIATHKRANLLRRAVLSSIQQTYSCHQVIVVSDAQDVDSYMAVADLLRPEDAFVQRQGVAGPSESRNLALKLLSGDYFVFLDDDDTFGPDFFATVIPFLGLPGSGDERLVYTNFEVFNEFPKPDGNFDVQSHVVDLSGHAIDTAKVKNFVPNNCVLYPISLASKIRFDSDIAYEDWDFFLSALRFLPAIHAAVQGPRIHKRQDESWEQRGKKNNERLLECYIKIYTKHPPENPTIANWRRDLFRSVGVDIATLVSNEFVLSESRLSAKDNPSDNLRFGAFDALHGYTVFAFWLGPYEMSPARTAAVKSIFRDTRTPVCFITDSSLKSWELSDSPFHEALRYLSEVHRADYLRCYLMHHYGGGYTDIKPVLQPWRPHFDELMNSDALALGYAEISPAAVAQLPGELGDQLRIHYAELIGYCSMVFKRKSALTQEWFDLTNQKLDAMLPLLQAHPAQHPMDQLGVTLPNGVVSDYPLRWTELGGNIFHPVILKYRNFVLKRESIKPQLHNYR